MREGLIANSRIAPLLAALCVCACASRQDQAAGDHLAAMNRPIQDFNQALAEGVVQPVTGSVESQTQTEDGGRTAGGEALRRVGRMLDNLGEPKNAVNGALQGNPGTVGTAVARFGLNSTVGLLGMYDVAGKVGLEERKEDFGQTLGTWGVGGGAYMVAPVVGSTTTRDAAGMVVDAVINPLGLAPIPGAAAAAASAGTTVKNAAENAETATAAADEADPYATQRRLYEQQRAAQIANADRAPRRSAPVEHRGDAPPAGGVADAPVAIAPGQPLVIDIYPLQATPGAPRPRPAEYAD